MNRLVQGKTGPVLNKDQSVSAPTCAYTYPAFVTAATTSPIITVATWANPAVEVKSDVSVSATSAATHDLAVGNTGSGQAHNNMQPYLGVNFIIALTGTFPAHS